jgi:hypothetical protein
MNKVDLYVNDFRLDLFNDEEISINISVQNVQDISKTFTDFTQSFTIPASPRNNEILQHYYGISRVQASPPRQVTSYAIELHWHHLEYHLAEQHDRLERAGVKQYGEQ